MNPSPRRPPLALRPEPVHSWLMAFDEDLAARTREAVHERVGPDGANEMDFTGRPMRGIVVVRGPLLAEPEALYGWVGVGVAYAQSQPPKPPKKPKGAHRN